MQCLPAGYHRRRPVYGAVSVDDDHTLYSVNPAVPYPSKNDQNSRVIRGRVLGVVASSDRPAKEDAGLLEELFVDEIREFNEEHGIRDW